jgi:hypothetical protein
MKIKILALLTLVSMNCFSQSIGELNIKNGISINPLKIEFRVYQEDSISMNLYDTWGNAVLHILPKDLYEEGTYKIEYTIAESIGNENYIYKLKSSDSQLTGSLMFVNFVGSSKPSDKVKITHIDSIKINDTIKITLIDTTNILIIDTINCVKTSTKLRNYETFSVSENLIFHDNLIYNFSGVDNLILYDMTGKFIRRLTISSNLINLEDLANGIYIGIFYDRGDIIKTIKLIKE